MRAMVSQRVNLVSKELRLGERFLHNASVADGEGHPGPAVNLKVRLLMKRNIGGKCKE